MSRQWSLFCEVNWHGYDETIVLKIIKLSGKYIMKEVKNAHWYASSLIENYKNVI